jgi:hypothetical protein
VHSGPGGNLPAHPAIAVSGAPARPPWNGKTNGFSIAALTMALFGCGMPVSITFGVLGLVQSRRNGDRRGRFFAIAALTINGIIILVIAGAIGASIARGPDRDATGAVRGERSIALDRLRVGDCIADISETSGYVDVVPCSAAHTSEVFAQFTLPAGEWPGETRVKAAADDGCEKRFPQYAGGKPDGSTALLGVPPDSLDWPGERGVTCLTYRLTPTTSSVRR